MESKKGGKVGGGRREGSWVGGVSHKGRGIIITMLRCSHKSQQMVRITFVQQFANLSSLSVIY